MKIKLTMSYTNTDETDSFEVKTIGELLKNINSTAKQLDTPTSILKSVTIVMARE